MSTSTLTTQITAMVSTFTDYLGVLITNFWPVVLGIGILLAVWYAIRHGLFSFR